MPSSLRQTPQLNIPLTHTTPHHSILQRPMTRYSQVSSLLSTAHEGHHHDDSTMYIRRATINPYGGSKTRDSLFIPRGPLHADTSALNTSDTHISIAGIRGGEKPSQRQILNMAEMSRSLKRNKEKHKPYDAETKNARRREQCRTNQARYRNKQRRTLLQLENDVERLNKEELVLKRRYRDVWTRKRRKLSPWSTVAEVFRLLEISFQSPWRAVSVEEMKRNTETRQILAILDRAFADYAAMGEYEGANGLLGQLRLYTCYFGHPNVMLLRVDSKCPGVMVATVKLTFTVTDITIKQVFPHLTQSANDDDRSQLYRRLLGHRLECNGSLTFLFDEVSNRVVRLETIIDMISPLMQTLGNIKDVCEVLQHSRLTVDNTIGSTTDH